MKKIGWGVLTVGMSLLGAATGVIAARWWKDFLLTWRLVEDGWMNRETVNGNR